MLDPGMYLILGLFLIGLGSVSLIQHVRGDGSLFQKLEPMRKLYGPVAGTVVHLLGYTVVPLAAGTIFVLSALRDLNWL